MSNKTNDWFAARLLNSDKPVEFLIEEGIDATNSSIQDKEFYKNKQKVQEAFTKSDGSFDNDLFDKFYENVSLEFKYLNSLDTENYILDSYEKSESNFSTNFGSVIDPKIDVERVSNPLDQSFGLVAPNKWSAPTKSMREAAQKNQYFDNDTGRWSDKTVNEYGVLGLLSGKSLVYASWDSDGTHIDPFTGKEVKHSKGEWKTDEFGNYYAETINNEEALDKQFVTWSEVLTDDESPWNKIDIFDSDNMDSNISRTLLKGVAIVGSSVLFPTVGASLFYTTAAINLARVLPQIVKSISSFFGSDNFDTLNKWDNTMRRFGRSSSDYSQEHFLSLENILNIAIDSYMQLSTQRAIAQIPQKLGIGQNAAKQMATAEAIQKLKLAQSGNVSQDVIDALAKSTEAYRSANKVFNNASKISTAISRAYLISTSVEDVYNQAKISGFDSQTAGFISLAAYAGVGALFQTDYFRGMLYNTPDYEIARDIKLLTRQWIKTSADKMKKDLGTATSEIAKQSKLKSWGNSFLGFIKNHANEIKSGRFGIVHGAINEGLEEVSEELVQDLSFQIGKSWQSVKELFTGKEYNNTYSYSDTDPLSRYSMSLFGGALGGAVFKLADRMHFQKNAYKQWKDMMGGDNSTIMKELVYHISQGKTDLILKQLDKLQKSPVLSTSLSAFTGEPTSNVDDSQNVVIFDMFRKAITDINSFLTNNNLRIDYNRFGDIELLRGVRTAWLTSVADNGKGIQDSLFQDYQKRITEIVNMRSEIQNKLSTLSDNANKGEVDVANKEVAALQSILDFKIDQVRKLVNGEDDSYIGRLMLETNKDILDNITPTTKDGIAKYLYGIEYSELPTIYQNKVDEQIKQHKESGLTEINYISAWNIYKNISGDERIKNEFLNLEQNFDNYQQLDSLSQEDIVQFTLLREAFKVIEPMWTEGQVLNIFYKMKGINSPVLDFEDSGDLNAEIINLDYVNSASEVYDSWQDALESAKSKINEDSSVFDKWLENYAKNSQLDKFSNQEGFSLLSQSISKDDFIRLIDDAYKSLADNPMGFGKMLPGRLIINSNNIDSLIGDIISKVDDVNKIDLILQQYEVLKSQGNKYFMSDEVKTSLDELSKLLKLVESIAKGSDIDYHTTILDIPFGANNYINKVFKDKGIDLELSQTSKGVIDAIISRLDYLQRIKKLLVETDLNNRGAVISTEKRLGIKYAEFKISCIKNIIDSSNIPQEFKDFVGNLDLSIEALDKNASDEDFIRLSTKYRNALLEFERNFHNYWKSLDDAKKIELISNITTVFNKDLYADTDSLNSRLLDTNSDGELLLNDSTAFMYIMSCSFGNSDLVTKLYKDNINNSDKFPFDSQEDIILTVSKFLLNENKQDVKLWLDTAISDKMALDNGIYKLYRCIKAVCSGGTGKTSTILPGIFNIISKVLPQKNIIFASNTNNQINAIKENINEANTVLISDILNDSINKDTFKSKYENSIIFVDECTNINESDLEVLDKLSGEYNVDIVYLGDVKQHSNGFSIDSAVCVMTTQLSESKRASTDVSRKNNNIFEKLFKQNSDGVPELNPIGLDKFTYFESENTLEGIKFENSKVLTTESIIDFYNKHNLSKDTRVLIFSDNLTSLDMSGLSNEYAVTFANDFAEIQGAEWDYTLTDINLTVEDTEKTSNYIPVYNKLKDIYTLFTRHKHGLISFNPLVLKDLTVNTKGTYIANEDNNDKALFAPVESGIVNDPEALKSFIDYKLKVLEGLNLVDSEYVVKDNVESDFVIEDRPLKSSLAQVASGFLLKKNFTDEFINSLGIEKNDYGVIRNILYSMLTSNNNALRSQLPELLRNGKFLIKLERVTVDDLYDLGNLYRDGKSLNGIHPWIVYHVDGQDEKDIYLGMFHNAETSEVNGSEISKTSSIINSLTSNMMANSAPKYYTIPDKLSISRSSNIVDIQNKETTDGSYIGLNYSDGKVIGTSVNGNNQRMDFLETSLSIYFRKGNENIVKVNSILKELNNLRSLYYKFYDLAIKNGLYSTDVESIKELLHFNRKDNSWEARGVPNLEDKFVIFVQLRTNDKVVSAENYLQTTSNNYLGSLQEKSRQLVDIIQVLESGASSDFKKEKVEEILSKRILFTSVPLAFDPEVITDKESFDEAIDNITYNIFRGSQRSRKAYNDALTHQLGYALRRFAALVKYKDQIKLAKNSKSWFDQEDLSNIILYWDRYKDGLINAYRQWSGISETDEDSLLRFLTETFTKVYTENGDKAIDVFTKDNANLLQTKEFKEFLRELYTSQSWPYIVDKLNSVKFFKLRPELQILFEGYMFPRLIKDNGINIITKGDSLNIQRSASFNLNSKVVQQGRIFVYGNESLAKDDFKEYINNEQTITPETSTSEDVSLEQNIENDAPKIFDSKVFSKTLTSIGRNGGKKIELRDRKQIGELIDNIYQEDSNIGGIVEKLVTDFATTGDYNIFNESLSSLYNSSESISNRLDTINSIISSYTTIC